MPVELQKDLSVANPTVGLFDVFDGLRVLGSLAFSEIDGWGFCILAADENSDGAIVLRSLRGVVYRLPGIVFAWILVG